MFLMSFRSLQSRFVPSAIGPDSPERAAPRRGIAVVTGRQPEEVADMRAFVNANPAGLLMEPLTAPYGERMVAAWLAYGAARGAAWSAHGGGYGVSHGAAHRKAAPRLGSALDRRGAPLPPPTPCMVW